MNTIKYYLYIAMSAWISVVFGAEKSEAGEEVSSSPIQRSRMPFEEMKKAKPTPLPAADLSAILNEPVSSEFSLHESGQPGFSKGSKGNGRKTPVRIPLTIPDPVEEELQDIAAPQEFGIQNVPYSTSRVDLGGVQNVSSLYPFRASGKLYYQKGTSSYVCSASLIKRGLLVTAAHCVTSWNNKANQYYTSFRYVPALHGATAPYGTWNVIRVYALSSYLNGTGTCAQAGVICNDDIAVLVVTPQNGVYPGTRTGWLGYAWDGYGFTPANLALISQLGYPVSHDSGLRMQRTDSQGLVTSSLANNTVWGSRQTGGSSGGPVVGNLGELATLSGTAQGAEGDMNRVIGVTSWGYLDSTIKKQGASPFLSTNIVPLVNTACAAYPAACQ